MTPRKKRFRYKTSAMKIASDLGLVLNPNNWEDIWGLLDKHSEPDYLYVVIDTKNKLFKFGKSKCPRTRISSINTGNGTALSLLAYCRQETPLTEKEVHGLLKAQRVHGEWFNVCEETQRVVDKIRQRHHAECPH